MQPIPYFPLLNLFRQWCLPLPGGDRIRALVFRASIGVILLFLAELTLQAEVSVYDLRCERLADPVGVDCQTPDLSWKLHAAERDVIQQSYRILAASRAELLQSDEADLWDSGRVETDRSIGVVYAGKKLESRARCFWKVKVWSNKGESEWSDLHEWTTGLFYQNQWAGRWIGFDRAFPWDEVSQFSRLSARYFRKEFEVDQGKKISRALVFVVGLGLYELSINGEKIGTQVLAPSPTDFTKNVKANCFDVTNVLASDQNAIGVVLGNGRYFTMRQKYKPYKIKDFGFPKLLLNLYITYDDGSEEVISTDDSWRGMADGPIRSNNEYDGEDYDARKEMPGWDRFGFDDRDWLPAEYVQEPGGGIEAQMNPNMKIMKRLTPIAIRQMDTHRWMLDMGQNMAGWLRMQVEGNSGDCVTLRFAESLDEGGALQTAALRDAKATDRYTLKGDGLECWEPTFVTHGFRYVEVSGYPGTPELEDFEGCVVYDQMDDTGSLETSEPLVNQLLHNAYWSIISNYKGIPIDCPQRNERMPWLGDRAVGCYGESFWVDNAALYEKWLEDIRLSQRADGALPDVAPTYFRYYSDNISWPGTYLFVVDMLVQQFGREQLISKHYPHMQFWIDYMADRYWDDGILTRDRYGDWCAPPDTIEAGAGKSADVKKPSSLIATAYFYKCLRLMEKFAKTMGLEQDAATYCVMAEQTKSAFNREFFDAENGCYWENKNTDNLLALAFSLVPDEQLANVRESLRRSIVETQQGHSFVGLIGAQWLMRTLSENGLSDVAELLLTQTSYPSWGYMVEQGATTIWELWNANTAAPNMNSQNHVMMLGDLVIWLFENVAGIANHPDATAFHQLRMQPDFPKRLEWAKAAFQSAYGWNRSEWKRSADGVLAWKIELPPNTSASVKFPPGILEQEILESGQALKPGDGIHSVHRCNDAIWVTLGSGAYVFTILNHHEHD